MSIRFHRLRSQKETRAGLSRRMFLMTTTMAGVTTGMMMAGARPAFAAFDTGQSATLLQMVQDIYPHPDLLDVTHYEAIVDTVSANAGADAAMAADLRDGLARIDAMAQDLYGVPYLEIEDPDAREGLLRAFQDEGFFQNVRWTAYFAIYDNKELWPLFGYEGSSVEYGGYLDRGFSDITFVPQGPSLEERIAAVKG